MKKNRSRFIVLLSLLPLLLLSGCNNPDSSVVESSLTALTEEEIREKYDLYYSYQGSMKGIECYAWKNGDTYYSGLIYGTNRLKSVEEIKDMQDNLPCPLPIMKKILLSYTEEEREYCSLFIVSMPPKEEEIQHTYPQTEEEIKEYRYVYGELGLLKDIEELT